MAPIGRVSARGDTKCTANNRLISPTPPIKINSLTLLHARAISTLVSLLLRLASLHVHLDLNFRYKQPYLHHRVSLAEGAGPKLAPFFPLTRMVAAFVRNYISHKR